MVKTEESIIQSLQSKPAQNIQINYQESEISNKLIIIDDIEQNSMFHNFDESIQRDQIIPPFSSDKGISTYHGLTPQKNINVKIENFDQTIIQNNYYHLDVIVSILLIFVGFMLISQFMLKPISNKNRQKLKKKKQNKKQVSSDDTSPQLNQNQIYNTQIQKSQNISRQLVISQNEPILQKKIDDKMLIDNDKPIQKLDQKLYEINKKNIFQEKYPINIQNDSQKVNLQVDFEEHDEFFQKTESSQHITYYPKNQKNNDIIQKNYIQNINLNAYEQGQNYQINILDNIDDLKKLSPSNTLTTKKSSLLAIEDSPVSKRKSSHYQSDSFETGRFNRVYEDIEIVGRGGFGEVYKAQHKIEKQVYAIKKIYLPIKKGDQIYQHKSLKEVKILSQLIHKNIIRYQFFWIEHPDQQFMDKFQDRFLKKYPQDSTLNSKSVQKTSQSQSQQDQQSQTETYISGYSLIDSLMPYFKNKDHIPIALYLQMQYCSEQTMKEYLQTRNGIDDKRNFQMFSQILEGVKYIHGQNIVHRDLKPANIFLDKGNIVIGDFGLSTIDNCQQIDLMNLNALECSKTTNLGTPMYAAPEQQNLSRYCNKVDIYSLGFILFEFYHIMETAHEKNQTMRKIRTQQFPQDLNKWQYQKSLIEKMTQSNPSLRPSIDEILNSEEYLFWKNYLEL